MFLRQRKEKVLDSTPPALLKVLVPERLSVPDDGVEASDLRRALQHAECLRKRLGLLSGGQQRPETENSKFTSKGFNAFLADND